MRKSNYIEPGWAISLIFLQPCILWYVTNNIRPLVDFYKLRHKSKHVCFISSPVCLCVSFNTWKSWLSRQRSLPPQWPPTWSRQIWNLWHPASLQRPVVEYCGHRAAPGMRTLTMVGRPPSSSKIRKRSGRFLNHCTTLISSGKCLNKCRWYTLPLNSFTMSSNTESGVNSTSAIWNWQQMWVHITKHPWSEPFCLQIIHDLQQLRLIYMTVQCTTHSNPRPI